MRTTETTTSTTSTTAASSGIRNNVLQRLATYQPQWMMTANQKATKNAGNVSVYTAQYNGNKREQEKKRARDRSGRRKSKDIAELHYDNDVDEHRNSSFSSFSLSSAASGSSGSAAAGAAASSENSEFILKPCNTRNSHENHRKRNIRTTTTTTTIAANMSPSNVQTSNSYFFNDVFY